MNTFLMMEFLFICSMTMNGSLRRPGQTSFNTIYVNLCKNLIGDNSSFLPLRWSVHSFKGRHTRPLFILEVKAKQ